MRTFRNYLLTSVCISLISFSEGVLANPEGGSVAVGQATISQSGLKMDILQHTDKSVIDWRSFDIQKSEHTQFHQPTARSLAVNRINDADPSKILGQLSANGRLVLINPNGILFGMDSRVDVAGLIATTANVSNDDVLSEAMKFDISGVDSARIINEGVITIDEAGLAAFVAPWVENKGVIVAELGEIQMVSSDRFTIDMSGDGLLRLEVPDNFAEEGLVYNSGVLKADGGRVYLTYKAAQDVVDGIIANTGVIEANSLRHNNGKIVLKAEGSNKTGKNGASAILNDGLISVSGYGEGEVGGLIEVLADEVYLLSNSVIDASGYGKLIKRPNVKGYRNATVKADGTIRNDEKFLTDDNRGGGSIKIGGDYLGQGDTQTSDYVYVDPHSLILNNAVQEGDGGRTIIWSDGRTDFYGTVQSRGGLNSGDGGFVETSGKQFLNASGRVDLKAPTGNKGLYFLDPANISIYGNVDPTFVSTDSSVDFGNDLLLWLDASDADTVTLSGTDVTYWTDKSGNGNDVEQTTGGLRADYDAVGFNGNPGIYFDGTDDEFSFVTPFSLDDSYSMHAAAFKDPAGNRRLGIIGNTVNGQPYVGWYHSDNHVYTSANNAGGAYFDAIINPTTPSLLRVSQSDINTLTHGLNGSVIPNGVSGTMSSASTTYSRLGFVQGSSNGRTEGHISEVIFFDETYSQEVNALIDQYQSAKWGVALNPYGTGGTEADRAMAADGYSLFSTNYLEYLSSSADISLLATNTINLDFRGDSLNLSADRNLSLTTTNGNITSLSAGTIRTNRTGAGGNISFTAGGGGDLTLSNLILDAQGGGVVNLSAGNSIDIMSTGTLNLGAVSANDILIRTSGSSSSLILNSNVSAAGTGNNLVLSTEGPFVNNVGATALNSGSGRWLVYTDDPANDIPAGLISSFVEYNSTYGAPFPAAISGSENGFLHAVSDPNPPVSTPELPDTVERVISETPIIFDTDNYESFSGIISNATDGKQSNLRRINIVVDDVISAEYHPCPAKEDSIFCQ